jgi:hypothetical protein
MCAICLHIKLTKWSPSVKLDLVSDANYGERSEEMLKKSVRFLPSIMLWVVQVVECLMRVLANRGFTLHSYKFWLCYWYEFKQHVSTQARVLTYRTLIHRMSWEEGHRLRQYMNSFWIKGLIKMCPI